MRRDAETGIVLEPRLQRAMMIAFFVAAAALLFMILQFFALLDHHFIRLSQQISPLAMIVAAIAYLASHLMRIIRLALLIGDARLSLRQLVAVHLFTSGVNLGLPFKLGEIYRVVELSAVTHGGFNALLVIWVERCFDIGVVLLLLLLLAVGLGPAAMGPYWSVLAMSLLFVTATLVLVTLLPDNLRRVGNHIIRRYEAPWTVAALKQIARARAMFHHMSRMLSGRYASLAVCTVLIWMLEGLSFALILIGRPTSSAPITGLLSFLSSTVEGATLPTRLAAMRSGSESETIVTYLMATQVPLLFVALAAGLYLGRQRIRLLFARRPAEGLSR